MRIIIVALTLLCATLAYSAKSDCDKATFDRCNEKLFVVGDDTFVFPKNIDEMNKRCKYVAQINNLSYGH